MPGGIAAPVISPTGELLTPTTKVRIACSADDVDLFYTVCGQPTPADHTRKGAKGWPMSLGLACGAADGGEAAAV
jgi:hypothetical protein